MSPCTSLAVRVASAAGEIVMADPSSSVRLHDQVGHHLVMRETAVFQAQDVVSPWCRECELQAVDVAGHRLGLCDHLQRWVVDPKPVVHVGTGNLELDRP